MRRRILAPALALVAAVAAAVPPDDEKKPETPFYRQYLVPGDPLDDQILEQDKRVEASPQDAALRTDFGNLLARRRFPEQAAEQYEMAAKLDSKNYVALYNLGLLLETRGKTRAAISAYRRSISRKPGFPPSRFHLGLLYERQNRLDAAVAEYARALRIDPAMRDPKRNPLVVESELMYRASLANYPHDRAAAAMGADAVYFEEPRFRRVPVDRALSEAEVAAEEQQELEPAPREVGPGSAAGAPGSEGSAPRRGARVTSIPEGAGPGPGTARPRPTPGGRVDRGLRPPAATGGPQAVPTPTPFAEEPELELEQEPPPEVTPTPGEPMEVEPS
jgi:tetratricopeptide (TPR) repeat protein